MGGPASIALAHANLHAVRHHRPPAVRPDQGPAATGLGAHPTRPARQPLSRQRPRPVESDQINIDSLIDWVPGCRSAPEAWRVPGNHVSWLQVPNVTGGALPALEQAEAGAIFAHSALQPRPRRRKPEQDAGRSRPHHVGQPASPGPDCRVLAETAIKRLYRLAYRAIKRAATGPVSWWSGKANGLPVAIPASGRTSSSCRLTS